jgi:hypothetical protein
MSLVHFVHIGKTGGTALKRGLRNAGFAFWRADKADEATPTPFGRIQLKHHGFKLADVPAGDYAFFCVRDPIDRFISAFYARLAQGRPRYDVPWNDVEREAFAVFQTPQQLGAALVSADPDECEFARRAMRGIKHLRATQVALGGRHHLWATRHQILYIARQETLDDDWQHIKALFGIPDEAELPSGSKAANRRVDPVDTSLDDTALQALRDWYRHEYRLVDYCEAMRAWHGWGTPPERQNAAARVRRTTRRLTGVRAIVPPPPPALTRRLYAR